VDELDAARALAGVIERAFWLGLTVADSTHLVRLRFRHYTQTKTITIKRRLKIFSV
jgi:hypothetical protein